MQFKVGADVLTIYGDKASKITHVVIKPPSKKAMHQMSARYGITIGKVVHR